MYASKPLKYYRSADPQPSWYIDSHWKVHQLQGVQSYKATYTLLACALQIQVYVIPCAVWGLVWSAKPH